MVAALTTPASTRWEANLTLSFTARNGKTILANKKHCGPLMVQKPFYPEANGCCHVYLIHPPGGIVGGDFVNLSASLGKNAHALITTPGATKFYRSVGPLATQQQSITLQDNASLEWLPQETVYYNQANASVKTKIDLNKNNRFFAWEIQCLGLPAQKQFFTSGQCCQKFEIWHENIPLLLETNRLDGSDPILQTDWGLQGHKSLGTFVCSNYNKSVDNTQVLNIIQQQQDLVASCTQVNDLFIIRAMSFYAENIKCLFTNVWQTLRPQILEIESSSPRIWLT